MRSKSTALYRLLIHPLATGEVKPGDRLDAERVLAKRYGVSRDTINRTLTQLMVDGFIEREPGRRAEFKNPLQPLFDTIVPETNPSPESLLSMLELRAELEGQAAFYCAQRATRFELARIDDEFKEMRQRNLGETTLSKAKADLRFHTLIADTSHHLAVSSFSQIFYARFFNAIYLVLDETLRRYGRYPDGISGQHASIHQALMRRDADMAKKCAREHVLYTADRYRQALDITPSRKA